MNIFRRYGALSGHGIDAAVSQGGGHDGQVATGDEYGTSAEIQIEDVVHAPLDHMALVHQGGDRPVAVAGFLFRAEGLLVDFDRVTHVALQHLKHGRGLFGIGVALHQRRNGDGAGVDHGIERPVVDLVQHGRIEGIARRLDPHVLEHFLAA